MVFRSKCSLPGGGHPGLGKIETERTHRIENTGRESLRYHFILISDCRRLKLGGSLTTTGRSFILQVKRLPLGQLVLRMFSGAETEYSCPNVCLFPENPKGYSGVWDLQSMTHDGWRMMRDPRTNNRMNSRPRMQATNRVRFHTMLRIHFRIRDLTGDFFPATSFRGAPGP